MNSVLYTGEVDQGVSQIGIEDSCLLVASALADLRLACTLADRTKHESILQLRHYVIDYSMPRPCSKRQKTKHVVMRYAHKKG